MPELDLVIRGGTLVDGTGALPRVADVGILDGRIAQIGQITATAAEEVDAAGLLVAPGWVDVHTHYDGQATWEHKILPSSAMGVTTVVFGNCGVGFAPVRPQDRDTLVRLMEGIEDIPGTALHEGLRWRWEAKSVNSRSLDLRLRTPPGHFFICGSGSIVRRCFPSSQRKRIQVVFESVALR